MALGRWLALGILLAAAPTARAQSLSRLQGTVVDETGRVLPGVTVDIRSTSAAFGRSTTTGSEGGFDFDALPPGRYQVTFRLPSFATSVRSVEAAGPTSVVNVTLHIALNADVLVTARRTFRGLTDLNEPVKTCWASPARARRGS